MEQDMQPFRFKRVALGLGILAMVTAGAGAQELARGQFASVSQGAPAPVPPPPAPVPPAAAPAGATKAEIDQHAEAHANDQIRGIKFGVGIAGTWGIEQIEEATLVAGTVRVSKGHRGTPSFWLESHLLVPLLGHTAVVKHKLRGVEMETVADKVARFGIGPFLAVQSTTENALEAMATGVMFGFRRPDITGSSK